MTRCRKTALAALCVLTLGACGVPADHKPHSINQDQIPFGLLDPSTTQTVTTLPIATVPQTVYMIGDDRLSPVTRTVASPPTLGTVLATLIQGPTDSESANSIRSDINSQASILSAQVADGTATINVSDAFSGLQLHDQILAIAQIVYTATEMPGVANVRLLINSAQSNVPRGDGSTTSDVLTRADYAQVAPTQNG